MNVGSVYAWALGTLSVTFVIVDDDITKMDLTILVLDACDSFRASSGETTWWPRPTHSSWKKDAICLLEALHES